MGDRRGRRTSCSSNWAFTAAACAALAVMMAAPVEAAPKQKQYVTTTSRSAPAGRARSRVVVVPRSFLDAGTEVAPGDRKFTDYALPPNHVSTGVITNMGGRVGWDRSPFMQPWELPGSGFNTWW